MDIRFDGKTALVTGAGKGIGRLLALKLAEAGANVIAVSRTQSDLDSLKDEGYTKDFGYYTVPEILYISEDCCGSASLVVIEIKVMNPEKIQTLRLDVGDWESTKEALQNIGPVDLLVNNAAIMESIKEFGDMSEEEVDRTMNINVKSVINITQTIVNGMKCRGTGGAIVNVSSVGGLYGVPHYGIYGSSKGALQQLTTCMAVEFGPHKIRVNSVNPTAVRTRMAEKEGYFDEDNVFANALKTRTPLRRFCEPEDVVGPILFLLSNYAAMITGVSIPIDGGLGVSYV